VSKMNLSKRPCLCFFIRDVYARRQTEELLRTVHNAIQNSVEGIAVADLHSTASDNVTRRSYACGRRDIKRDDRTRRPRVLERPGGGFEPDVGLGSFRKDVER